MVQQQNATPKKTRAQASVRKRAFLAAYSQCGSLTHAARAAKINRCTHYRWLKDQEYSAAFGEAREEAADALEMEARRRAVEGIEEPVFYKGEVCGTIRKYSDTLLIFLLKGVRPEKYRERTEHTGPDGGPFEFTIKIPRPGNSEDSLSHG